MKKIVKRSTGENLTVEEAHALCEQIHSRTGGLYYEHTSVYSYPTSEMATTATFAGAYEIFNKNWIFAFARTINKPFEDYRVHVAVSKIHPEDFEALFQDYVVLE